MQAGYSLSLGELVPAADAEYDDCAKFQITCPACREAVFKSLRTQPREVHYFSHYRAVDDAALCELRVAQLAKQAGIVDGIMGHEQTLKKFLANFRDNIISGYERASGVNLRRQAMKIYIQPYLDEIADRAFREVYSMIWKGGNPRTNVQQVTAMSTVVSCRSPFWHRRAASYVLDALRHLDTEQASTNRRLLIALGFASWPRRRDDFLDWRDSHGDDEFMLAISQAQPRKVVLRLAREAKLTSEAAADDDGYQKQYSGMRLADLKQTAASLKGEIKRLKTKQDDAMADMAGLNLLVPILTLLALGYDN